MVPLQATFIEKDNVLLIGQACIDNQTSGRKSWGYNLVLRKENQTDLYGEWWAAWFEDSGIYAQQQIHPHYAIRIPHFYEEYEFGRSNTIHVRRMHISKLATEGIDKLINKLFE